MTENDKKQVEVGDPVRDHVYGVGITYVGTVTGIDGDTVTASLSCKQSFFQSLFGSAPDMGSRVLEKSDFFDWNGEVWNLDTFL